MPVLTDTLRNEYQNLFTTCQVKPERQAEVESSVDHIVAHQSRYQSVSDPLGIPWFFTGIIHLLEGSLNFSTHLHNGDPLTARTVHVPAGRPVGGTPPFTWEESATDALKLEGLDTVTDWTTAGILYQMESYNGFGYRKFHPEVLSPYLWSGSNQYTKGKFVADGKFDPDAVSSQIGAAVIFRRMAERHIVPFGTDGNPALNGPSVGTLSLAVIFSSTVVSAAARNLQTALNQIPGIILRVDGVPGRRTSDAVHSVTGHFLSGDPQDTSGGGS